MAKLIKFTGETVEVRPADGTDRFRLEEIQKLVDGYVEVVRGLIVNEEGVLMGLPYNEEASRLTGVTLVGNVVQLTSEEWKATMN